MPSYNELQAMFDARGISIDYLQAENKELRKVAADLDHAIEVLTREKENAEINFKRANTYARIASAHVEELIDQNDTLKTIITDLIGRFSCIDKERDKWTYNGLLDGDEVREIEEATRDA